MFTYRNRKLKKYKYCFVPMCNNTTKTTPHKLFVSVPKIDQKMRGLWFEAVRRDIPCSKKSDFYCCEDHIDVENDIENYMYLRYFPDGRIRLKPGAIPTKLECQKPRSVTRTMELHQPLNLLYCYYCNSATNSKSVLRHHVIKCMINTLPAFQNLTDFSLTDTVIKLEDQIKLETTDPWMEPDYKSEDWPVLDADISEEIAISSNSCNYSTNLEESTEIKPNSCPYCGHTMIQSGELNQLMISHIGEKHYSCTYCDYKSTGAGSLKLHSRTHTGEKPYSCGYCEYTASHPDHLTHHLRTHTGENPYSCGYCEYTASQLDHLTQHLRTHTEENPYSCGYCEYTVSQPDHLTQHLRTHTEEKPYACDFCEFASYHPRRIKRHLRTHTEEKPYSCGYCEYTASRPDHLKLHLRTHTEKQLYSCDFCEFTSYQPGRIKRHLRTHTKTVKLKTVKLYCCSLCNYKAKRPGSCNILKRHDLVLERHLGIHAGEKYSGVYCNYVAKKLGRLQQEVIFHEQ